MLADKQPTRAPEARATPARGATARKAGLAVIGAAIVALAPASGAGAQELRHTFINPSFGGNPFNSDHLLAIANINRPEEPVTPAMPISETELISRQIQARLLSQLSSDITEAIANARPGDRREFMLGDERISFVRTTTETTITFFNARTGVTNTIVLPVQQPATPTPPGTTPGPTPPGNNDPFFGPPRGGTSISAEQALGAPGTRGTLSSDLLGATELPAGPPGL